MKQPYKDQYEKAVLSIALNLAEGSAKESKQDRLRFYEYALGSFKEARTVIQILELESLYSVAENLGAALYCLCCSLRL